ncbi:MAG TPA: cytochrome P450 [Caulobacteraceae bacterium]|nr:cytochrome P450 [Caulobacteraceae bacterium]
MRQWPADANILDPGIFPGEKGPPHALFDAWREADPVHWNPATPDYVPTVPASSMTKGFWVLTRYQDVFDVSRDQERFSSFDEGFVIWDLEDEELALHRANFMGMRPADHSAVKQLVLPAFSPKAMRVMTPEIDRLAREIIDDISGRGQCEFVFEVASKLPVYTFCELMGIPEHLRSTVVDLGNAMADVETRGDRTLDPMPRLFAIAEGLSEEKRRRPDGSLMSVLVHDQTLGLSQMNINMLFIVFAVAGHETTRSTAAHFMYLMSAHPEQYRLLLSDIDGHLENAIEEVLRFTSTTTNFRRTATIDTEIGGQPVKKGDKIYLSYAAANRDQSVFEHPHAFDITRANARKHLAFGTGPHVCIGARLARMELHALLKQIVTRIPDFRITGEPEWLRSIWFNAVTRLPIAFTPERAATA